MYDKTKPVKPFEKKVYLASPTMHGEELQYMTEAYSTNWMSTVGENLNQVEKLICEYTGSEHAVALASGTAALHMAMKLAGEQLYGRNEIGKGALAGKKVFCSDVTFDATVNPIVYEGGEPVFIETECDTWNMDPEALEKAFEIYPEVRLVVLVHLYGTPAKIREIQEICKKHNALLIEDAAESLAATYEKKQTGTFGDIGIISFNGNKLITGSSGGAILLKNQEQAAKVRKWSTQSREDAPWYQHEELGYNYRMSNVIAGVVRGQMGYIDEHKARKKEIYLRYQEGFKDLPIIMNPYEEGVGEPNYWLSCLLIDADAMCTQERTDREAHYTPESGKSCPTELMEAITSINAESRPIWKPMHMQPIYRKNAFINKDGIVSGDGETFDIGKDIFDRGLCLPSDIKMTEEEQARIIDVVRKCFE